MFRSGTKPILTLETDGGEERLFALSEPSADVLALTGGALLGVAPPVEVTVERQGKRYRVEDDRDAEELLENERVRLKPRLDAGKTDIPFLKDYPLTRADLPCSPGLEDRLLMDEDALDGAAILESLRKEGYFFIRLSNESFSIVRQAFDSSADFFEKEERKACQPTTSCCQVTGHQKLAHNIGWRAVDGLKKEFFVYRQGDAVVDPKLVPKAMCAPLCDALLVIGKVLERAMRKMLLSLGKSEEEIGELLAGCLDPVSELRDVPFCSFIEIFKYDCTSRAKREGKEDCFNLSCPSHRDTGLFTAIPRSRGTCAGGLEVFNWKSGDWHSTEDVMGEKVRIFFFFVFLFARSEVSILRSWWCLQERCFRGSLV
jgi:hypothetical protein